MSDKKTLMKFTDKDLETIESLEAAPLANGNSIQFRISGKHFAPDFLNLGVQSRTYNRDQMIRTEPMEINSKLPLKDFKVNKIDDFTILVTYISEVQYKDLERGNRSSLWSMYEDGWKLRFHQGTPIIG